MRTFYISVSTANASASALSASSTVYFQYKTGKHKDHDVKTIKKSAPAVRADLEKAIDKI